MNKYTKIVYIVLPKLTYAWGRAAHYMNESLLKIKKKVIKN